MAMNHNELNLRIDEKILYTTEPIEGGGKNKKYPLGYSCLTFICVISFVFSTIGLINIMTNTAFDPLFWVFIMITTFSIILGIIMVMNYFNRNKRTLFYITNHSIIRFRNHAFKINKENLSHFWCKYRSLLFVSNRKKGTSLNNGSISQTKYQISLNNVSYSENYGIYLSGAHNFSITKNVINKNYGKGIYLDGLSFYNTISKNEITNNRDEGIYLEGLPSPLTGQPLQLDSYNRISENKVNNNSNGIVFNATDINQIINNIVNYNRNNGILLHNSDLNNIVNNTVNNNYIGINLANGISNTITANTINDNERYGIHLHYTDFTSILDNTINTNYIGVNVSNSKRNDIDTNEINNNHFGIYFTESRLNTVIENTLLNNVKCFEEVGSNVDNTFEDNECPDLSVLDIWAIVLPIISFSAMAVLIVYLWMLKRKKVRA